MSRQAPIRREDGADEASPQVFDAVHARILNGFPALVAELGGDAHALLRQVGVDPEPVLAGDAEATYRQTVELMALAALELGCPDFGLRLARAQGGRMFGPLGQVMRRSRTFGEAIEYTASHNYAHSLAAAIWLRRHPGEGALFVGHDILLDGLDDRSQAMEQILLVGHLTAMELTGGYARARRVHFRHQAISPAKAYRRHFGCDVLFGQSEDGVFYFDQDLSSPVVDHDAQAHRIATAYVESEFARQAPLQAQARGLVMQSLGTDRCTNEAVADALNLHPRTLHRRLAAERTSFQQVKDEVRRDLMRYYLEHTDFGVAWISEKLGFAEQSVMTRRCNRWLGAAPTEVRRRARMPKP